jgi:hypothetical protein
MVLAKVVSHVFRINWLLFFFFPFLLKVEQMFIFSFFYNETLPPDMITDAGSRLEVSQQRSAGAGLRRRWQHLSQVQSPSQSPQHVTPKPKEQAQRRRKEEEEEEEAHPVMNGTMHE